jgi:hypothetical protein
MEKRCKDRSSIHGLTPSKANAFGHSIQGCPSCAAFFDEYPEFEYTLLDMTCMLRPDHAPIEMYQVERHLGSMCYCSSMSLAHKIGEGDCAKILYFGTKNKRMIKYQLEDEKSCLAFLEDTFAKCTPKAPFITLWKDGAQTFHYQRSSPDTKWCRTFQCKMSFVCAP